MVEELRKVQYGDVTVTKYDGKVVGVRISVTLDKGLFQETRTH